MDRGDKSKFLKKKMKTDKTKQKQKNKQTNHTHKTTSNKDQMGRKQGAFKEILALELSSHMTH